jgi:hypothetical protein
MRAALGRNAIAAATAIGTLLAVASVPAIAGDPAPLRSSLRLQAIAALSAGGSGSSPCLTPVVQSMRAERQRGTSAARRSFAALANEPALPGERVAIEVDGVSARFTTDRNAFDRVELADDNANGRPDAVDDVLSGIAKAQRLLVAQLELPNPGTIEIVLGRLGSNVDGLSLPFAGKHARTHIWLDPAVRGGGAMVRQAAEHQYAHAVAAAAVCAAERAAIRSESRRKTGNGRVQNDPDMSTSGRLAGAIIARQHVQCRRPIRRTEWRT